MAVFRERDKHYFPLKCIEDVVCLFKGQLESDDEPDLTLLSIVTGAVEACLTVNRNVSKAENEDTNCAAVSSFPAIHLHTVEALYQRFSVYVKGSVDLTQYDGRFATRQLVKKVSDVVWNSLARSYHKDKAHLQSIYSLLTGNKLDCFGVALATVAACQQLSFADVHLALSEDHAWVVYGESGRETIEVTWHGKGLEDRRGLPISEGLEGKSWLYLNGNPVMCNRYQEVAAIVSGINPAINASTDSVELASLQQKILWYLYDKGHLQRYPLALGNLGELADASPQRADISPLELFNESIASAKGYYNNMYVYPYTYLGSYHHRKGRYRDAIENWAKAASVISQYNHNREDEEIYKEFLEISNEHIPNIVKVAGEELHRANLVPTSATPLLRDPRCYSLLLQFYDGICQWEEDSSTPVLHSVWAHHLVHTLGKFEEEARINIDVDQDLEDDDDASDDQVDDGHRKWKLRRDSADRPPERRDSVSSKDRALKRSSADVHTDEAPIKRGRGRPPKKVTVGKNNNNLTENGVPEVVFDGDALPTASPIGSDVNGTDPLLRGPEPELLRQDSSEDQIKSAIEELVSRVGSEVQSATPNPELAALAQACGESILNPAYLINGGEPFASSAEELFQEPPVSEHQGKSDLQCTKSNQNPGDDFLEGDSSSIYAKEDRHEASDEAQIVPENSNHLSSPETHRDGHTDSDGPEKPPASARSQAEKNGVLVQTSLHSAKMRGLKNILTARKLNANAVKLQLTAQSQVYLKHSVSGNANVGITTRKRLRRE